MVFDETFELVVSGAEANVAFFCQLFAIVAVLELQNLNVVVFYGLGFGASFVSGVSWEKTDFGAKSAIARANKDAFIDVCYAAVGKKMPRGEREKRFAGAKNARDNYNGDFFHRGKQGFHYHGLTSRTRPELLSKAAVDRQAETQREQSAGCGVATADVFPTTIVGLGIIASKLDKFVGQKRRLVGESLFPLERVDFVVRKPETRDFKG